MNKSTKVIDLRKDKQFLQDYVNLRNFYSEVLLTSKVDIVETERWTKEASVEIRGMVEGNVLLGAVILYLQREGEIAFFVRHPDRGTGSQLLKIVEEVAKQQALRSIWGWVLDDNPRGQRAFEKRGFVKEGKKEKEFKGQMKSGTLYRKYLDA